MSERPSPNYPLDPHGSTWAEPRNVSFEEAVLTVFGVTPAEVFWAARRMANADADDVFEYNDRFGRFAATVYAMEALIDISDSPIFEGSVGSLEKLHRLPMAAWRMLPDDHDTRREAEFRLVYRPTVWADAVDKELALCVAEHVARDIC